MVGFKDIPHVLCRMLVGELSTAVFRIAFIIRPIRANQNKQHLANILTEDGAGADLPSHIIRSVYCLECLAKFYLDINYMLCAELE